MLLRASALAKVNLTLHVLGRRADGFHELDSLVAFAGCAADALTLEPGPRLSLGVVEGPFAAAAAGHDDNLVLRATREAAARIEGLKLGAFSLTKRIPVAAGLGGGSADAAAALRLIAELNALSENDPRIVEAAAATGSDVPACLVSRSARMTGRGERIERVEMAPLPAILMNPLKAVSTADIFRALDLKPGEQFAPPERTSFTSPRRGEVDRRSRAGEGPESSPETSRPSHPALRADLSPPGRGEDPRLDLQAIFSGRNDLEPPARALLPAISDGIAALAATNGCRLARMSGSGATVFGLFNDHRAARRAARPLAKALPGWWVRPTLLR